MLVFLQNTTDYSNNPSYGVLNQPRSNTSQSEVMHCSSNQAYDVINSPDRSSKGEENPISYYDTAHIYQEITI